MDTTRFQSCIAVFFVTVFLLTTDISTANDIPGFTPILRYPGDVNVLVLLHFRETFNSDFLCTGPFNPRIPYDVEALRFAIDRANDGLEDFTIGLTVVDPCGSPAVALRDVVGVLSDSDTAPTIGILVPGVGEVTRAVFERVTRVLDIPTIGYFPTEERFLMGDEIEAGMLGSDGIILFGGNGRGDLGGAAEPSNEFSSTRSTPTNGRTESRTTNVQGVSANASLLNSSVAGSPSPISTQTPEDVFVTQIVTDSSNSRIDTISEEMSTSNTIGDEDGENQEEEADEEDVEESIFLLTSAVSLDSDASAITRILVSASWYNVGVIYSGYGTGPFRRTAFIRNAEIDGICVAFEQRIPRRLTQEMSDRIIRNLVESSDNVEVVVWIVSSRELQLLLRSIRLVEVTFRGVGIISGISNTLEGFVQTEDGVSIFLNDLESENNTDYLNYINRLNSGESEFNDWMNFTLNSSNMATIEASHTSSLMRAIEMIACGFRDALNQTEDSDEGLSTTDIRRAILNKDDFRDITKSYGVYLMNDSTIVQIGNVNASQDIDLEGYNLPDAYRSDGCICLQSGLSLAEPVDSPWTNGFSDPWIPAIFSFSIVFGLLAFVLFFAFIFFSQRPSMKKTTVLANVLLLLGIMLMYFINLFFTLVPTVLWCGFRQFGTAFIYAWVFSALLVKSIAVLINLPPRRDYDPTNEPRTNKLNNLAQLCAFCAFLAPQIALSVQWVAFKPPAVVSDPNVCGSLECEVTNLNIALSLIYVFILILVTFVLSLCRLGDSSLMNESRSLFLSSFSTMFLLSGWIVAFTVADPVYQVPAICVGVTANATVILCASFGPACCVLTCGRGTMSEEEKEANGDIAYVNPALVPTTESIDGNDERTML